MGYIYSLDGANGGTTPAAPSVHPIQPDVDQGFPKQLIRREFTTLVALRNFNP
jgi:type IV pilus assembly protein PilW